MTFAGMLVCLASGDPAFDELRACFRPCLLASSYEEVIVVFAESKMRYAE